MPEFSKEPRRDREVEKRTTLLELQKLLGATPEIFGDKVEEIKQAVKDAGDEIERRGNLSQETAEKLDNLHRPFK